MMRQLLQRLVAALALMLMSAPAFLPRAMAVREAGAPQPSKPWLQWIVTVLMAGACAAIMFKNAKRSHQD
jgi:type IV secretory pathway VirB2 component (pilin)